jgi:hypothetical protein
MVNRPGAAITIVAAAAILLVGCSSGDTGGDTGGKKTDRTGSMTSDQAKQAVVDIVDRSYAELGGDWTIRSGPAVQSCVLPSGDSGAAYSYIVDRKAGGTPLSNVAKLQDLWKANEITTQAYENGGNDPVRGVRGAGGPTTSIDLYADPIGYTIEGLSVCAPGDAAEMQGNGE